MMSLGQQQGQTASGNNTLMLDHRDRVIDIEAPPLSTRASQSSLPSVEGDHTQKGSRDKSYVPFIMTRATDLEAAQVYHSTSIDEELEYGIEGETSKALAHQR
jgi:hypothetical protein